MSADTNPYRLLQQHLDTGPVGYPATPSGIDIRLLQQLFTPEEALIAACLSTIHLEPATRIRRRAIKAGIGMTPEDFQQRLDTMAFKGFILVYREGLKEKRYKNAGVTAGGIVDFQVDRLTKELVDTFHQYHVEVFAKSEMTGARSVPQLRTIPVERSIPTPDKHGVATYDDVRKLVNDAPGPFAVANCVCRQTKDIQGQPCAHSDIRETCLQIGPDHARQYIEMGIGREISREEVFEILHRAQQAGFILQPENSRKPEAICCCCGDCCGLLGAVIKAPRPAAMYASNYYGEVDASLCLACGDCVTRCQLGARSIANGVSVINLDRCIGCGNCLVTCKANAGRLVRKAAPLIPPPDKDAAFMAIMEGRKGRWQTLKIKLKMILAMRV